MADGPAPSVIPAWPGRLRTDTPPAPPIPATTAPAEVSHWDIPEKLIDFAWRSEHEMTVKAKTLIKAFYGEDPKLSYWIGCSSGGKQGLKEAQRFPDDFDGIAAGAPVLNWTARSTEALWVAQAALKDPASYIPAEKYPLIHQAAIAACDQQDGLKDGLISDPTGCHFDPAALECKEGGGEQCLTHPQVEAVRKIYAPALNSRTGAKLSPGFEPGSELGWRAIIGGPQPFSAAGDYFKYVVFRDPMWNWRTFNLDSDAALADRVDDGTINASSADLKRFVGHRGKLILYHGWTDTNITPGATVDYYKTVVDQDGRRSRDRAIGSPVHDSGNESLWRRRGAERLQHGEHAGAMGGRRQGARSGAGLASHQRKSGPHAAALSVSADGAI